ncbi:hypothetical protein EJ03DRAFT_43055 [Teratosphaeria nubilosa]|uniref:Uncharacterized protein n=1 Tax=Teratosphaeria nubilosa TaxID=161662 RepID=A0A6G1KTV1_9PEZI|nr:hypothetical protein EJ03DRAFT_43055 [Teratosphaeria nubilosa]
MIVWKRGKVESTRLMQVGQFIEETNELSYLKEFWDPISQWCDTWNANDKFRSATTRELSTRHTLSRTELQGPRGCRPKQPHLAESAVLRGALQDHHLLDGSQASSLRLSTAPSLPYRIGHFDWSGSDFQSCVNGVPRSTLVCLKHYNERQRFLVNEHRSHQSL